MYEPRRLTPEEAKVNALLPIDDLLTPKNYSEDTNIEKQVLKHVPKGLNKDKGWKDADAVPGSFWEGMCVACVVVFFVKLTAVYMEQEGRGRPAA